jgi:hypothetical protein
VHAIVDRILERARVLTLDRPSRGLAPLSGYLRRGAFHAITDGERGLTSQLTVTVLAGVVAVHLLVAATSSVTRCNAVDNSRLISCQKVNKSADRQIAHSR